MILTRVVRNGRAHHILKDTFKRRKTKHELQAQKAMIEQEKAILTEYDQLKQYLSSKGYKPTDLPQVIQQHERMTEHMKDKENQQ